MWEAQVSLLGLHSKQWLAHHNEFLPETKSKSISKVPKSGNMQRCTKALPFGIRPTASAIEDGSVVLGCFTLSMGVPSPQRLKLSMFSSIVVWPVSRLPVPRPRVSALQVSDHLPLLNQGFNALPNIDRHGCWRGWSSEGAWTLNQSIHL